jgi:hypothetical protein
MEMMNPTGSQRLRSARLRRPLLDPFWHRQPASPMASSPSAGQRPRFGPAPPPWLSPERITMDGSFLRWRIIGYRLRGFHFPIDP